MAEHPLLATGVSPRQTIMDVILQGQ